MSGALCYCALFFPTKKRFDVRSKAITTWHIEHTFPELICSFLEISNDTKIHKNRISLIWFNNFRNFWFNTKGNSARLAWAEAVLNVYKWATSCWLPQVAVNDQQVLNQYASRVLTRYTMKSTVSRNFKNVFGLPHSISSVSI